jgi:hypothetical protein
MSIYKYVSSERIDILKNAYIRFTQPAAFNDPFESFPYFKTIVPENDIDDFLHKREWDRNELEKMLKESWQKQLQKCPGVNIPFDLVKDQLKVMMEQSKPFIADLFKGLITMREPFYRKMALNAVIQAMNKEIGILCLTEKRDNLLMWAHYSSNHTGFVIEFNKNHSFFDQRTEENEIRRHLKKVRYSLKRPEVILLDPSLSNKENIDRWIKDIFWVKSKHWEYEQEWRMIQTLRDCQKIIHSTPNDIYLFPIPKDCITSIILGCRISNDDKQAIFSFIKSDREYAHVKLIESIMDEREYKLNFIDF